MDATQKLKQTILLEYGALIDAAKDLGYTHGYLRKIFAMERPQIIQLLKIILLFNSKNPDNQLIINDYITLNDLK